MSVSFDFEHTGNTVCEFGVCREEIAVLRLGVMLHQLAKWLVPLKGTD